MTVERENGNRWLVTYGMVIYLTLVNSVVAQEEWTLLSQNLGIDFRSLHFVTEEVGWAAGSNLTIALTRDGGTTWQIQKQNRNSRSGFESVFFIDEQHGWVVSSSGTTMRTVNGGTSWTEGEIDAASLWEVQFANPQEGWIVGEKDGGQGRTSIIWHTDDGGKTWTPQYHANQWLHTMSLWVLSDQLIWATGDDCVIHTSDGGQAWQKETLQGNLLVLNDIAFVTAQEGWVVGIELGNWDIKRNFFPGTFGVILHTVDDGKTWKRQYEGQPYERIHALAVLSDSRVVAVGRAASFQTPVYHGVVLTTEDGGQHWQRQEVAEPLFDVSFATPDVGWASRQHNVLLHTQDGGRTWNPLLEPAHLYSDVFFTRTGQGYVLGQGSSWVSLGPTQLLISQELDRAFHPDVTFSLAPQSLVFLGSDIGMAVGWGWARTQDGGDTWDESDHGEPLQQDVCFPSSIVGYSVGLHGSAYKTVDAGMSWQRLDPDVNEELHAVAFLDTQHGIAVGGTWQQGVILRTKDGGKRWDMQPQSSPLRGLFFLDDHLGWSVGYHGSILHTTNGGQKWQEQESPTTAHLLDVCFVSETEGWAVGRNGTILHTANGGQTWQEEESGTQVDLTSLSPTHRGGLVAVGDWSTILYRACPSLDLSVSPIDRKPVLLGSMKTQLLPNYPNPFNPETWIPFMLAGESSVTIEIFDIQGHLVRRFNLGTMASGNYVEPEDAIHWDGCNQQGEVIGAGIYFCRLTADNIQLTRRMLLCK